MKHRKAIVVLVAVLAMTLGSLGVGNAIQWAWPDGEDHPYVGMMVSDVDGKPTWRCSGVLIAPQVFLTAAHCVYGTNGARVWFDTDMSDNSEYPYGGETSVEGTPIAHPDYDGTLAFPNPSDLGVIDPRRAGRGSWLWHTAVDRPGGGAERGAGFGDTGQRRRLRATRPPGRKPSTRRCAIRPRRCWWK